MAVNSMQHGFLCNNVARIFCACVINCTNLYMQTQKLADISHELLFLNLTLNMVKIRVIIVGIDKP